MKIFEKTAFRGLCIFVGMLLLAIMVKVVQSPREDPYVTAKRIAYEGKKWELKVAYLDRSFQLHFWGTTGLLSALSLALVIVATGIHRAKVRAASIHTAKIGDSLIPVHFTQIERGELSEELTALANAEALKQHNAGLDKAVEIHLALAEVETQRLKALASRYRQHPASIPAHTSDSPVSLPLPSFTMQHLIQQGDIAPGTPIPFGHISTPYHDIISLGVAGWQKSGKTNAIAFLTGSLIYAAGADAYIIDPHKEHPEGLSQLLKPLEDTGRMHSVPPFDTQGIIEKLDALLNDRLADKLPSDPPVLLVIDELPRLSRFPVWDRLVQFLVRCVTETRKANITFIGGSHIWTAKYFNGKSEIRQCLNSTLILPTKQSQADLLLEDAQEKKLVKALNEPGKGLLTLNMHEPALIKMPHCTRTDMMEIANRLQYRESILDIDASTPLTKDEMIRGRKRLKLSQTEFGAKVGLTQRQVSRLESGQSDMIKLEPDILNQIVDLIDPLDTNTDNVVNFLSKAQATGV